MDRQTLEDAIRSLALDAKLLERFKAKPAEIGSDLGLDAEWSDVIARGDRDRLRSAGLNDGVTILVSRWFKDDLGDSTNVGRFHVDVTSPLPRPDVPRHLVFAAGCSHVPDVLARPEIDPADAVNRLLAGYEKLAQKLAAATPELIIVTADCHFQRFESGASVVGVGQRHRGSMAFFKRPDIDLEIAGDPTFAAAIAKAVRAQGLEVEEAPQVDLDHGLIVPLRLLKLTSGIPVVPIITQPARTFSPFGARAFGVALRNVIDASGKRVAVLATGGLSHWLDPGKFGKVDVEFDSYILDMLKAGRGISLADLEPYPLLDHGQYEILNWLIMLGAVGPGVRGEVFAYEPMQASGGGWTVVNMMLPGRAPAHA
jgi:aromatic ring-opening dioxygenase catalytic subunit (LigB family)